MDGGGHQTPVLSLGISSYSYLGNLRSQSHFLTCSKRSSKWRNSCRHLTQSPSSLCPLLYSWHFNSLLTILTCCEPHFRGTVLSMSHMSTLSILTLVSPKRRKPPLVTFELGKFAWKAKPQLSQRSPGISRALCSCYQCPFSGAAEAGGGAQRTVCQHDLQVTLMCIQGESHCLICLGNAAVLCNDGKC